MDVPYQKGGRIETVLPKPAASERLSAKCQISSPPLLPHPRSTAFHSKGKASLRICQPRFCHYLCDDEPERKSPPPLAPPFAASLLCAHSERFRAFIILRPPERLPSMAVLATPRRPWKSRRRPRWRRRRGWNLLPKTLMAFKAQGRRDRILRSTRDGVGTTSWPYQPNQLDPDHSRFVSPWTDETHLNVWHCYPFGSLAEGTR